MRLATFGARSILRNRFRTVLTIGGVAVAIVAFVLLRTVQSSWTSATEHAAKDRIVTRHKVSFVMPLPSRYVTELSRLPGVSTATHGNWFGGKDPNHAHEFFPTIAVEPEPFLEVFDDVVISAEARDNWLKNRSGAIIGDLLAEKLGWHVGDKVTLEGSVYPGAWSFTVSGVYQVTRKAADRSTLYFHFNYLNEWLKQHRPNDADKVGWISSRIEETFSPAEVARRVDAHFEERDIQTLSQDEHSFNSSFLGMLSAILRALDIISGVILTIMMLILGNTIAMSVRERTHEYGVLRAIGFQPRHLALFVLGESATIGLLGGVVGLLIAYPVVEGGVGRFLEENVGAFFPYFRIDSATSLLALGLSALLGVSAALIPAYQVTNLEVVSALRKVD